MTSTSTIIGNPSPNPPASDRRASGRRWLGRLAFRAACLGLVALNAWWLARDLWPVPDRVAIHTLMARGKLVEAEAAMRAHLAREPRDGEIRQLLARQLAQKGDALGCAEQLHQVPDWWPARPGAPGRPAVPGKREAQFLEGQAYQQAGLVGPAEAAYRGVVRFDPYHPIPWPMIHEAGTWLIARAMVEERRDDAREVLREVYREARDVSPGSLPGILATRVRVEIERIEPAEAVRTLRKDLEADPGNRALRRALALALQDSGEPDAAEREITTLLKQSPTDPKLWSARLTILRERNDPDAILRAVDAMPAEVARAPLAAIQQARGQAAEVLDQIEEARKHYAEAVRLDPFDPENHFRLARVEQRLGHGQSAEEHRQLHRRLLSERRALPAAYSRFKMLAEDDPSGGIDYRQATRRLAEIATTLGWPWLAEGLRDLIAPGM